MSLTILHSGCQLKCKTLGQLSRELDMTSWPLSKYHKTFLALGFWRVNYIEQDQILNHLNITDIHLT